jgi:hypothetical protein
VPSPCIACEDVVALAPFQVTPGDVSVEAQARQEQSDRAQEQIVVLNQQLDNNWIGGINRSTFKCLEARKLYNNIFLTIRSL